MTNDEFYNLRTGDLVRHTEANYPGIVVKVFRDKKSRDHDGSIYYRVYIKCPRPNKIINITLSRELCFKWEAINA